MDKLLLLKLMLILIWLALIIISSVFSSISIIKRENKSKIYAYTWFIITTALFISVIIAMIWLYIKQSLHIIPLLIISAVIIRERICTLCMVIDYYKNKSDI